MSCPCCRNPLTCLVYPHLCRRSGWYDHTDRYCADPTRSKSHHLSSEVASTNLQTLFSHLGLVYRACLLFKVVRDKRLSAGLTRLLSKVPRPATLLWIFPIGFGIGIACLNNVKLLNALVAVSIIVAYALLIRTQSLYTDGSRILDFVTHHVFERLRLISKPVDSESCTSWSSETTLGKAEAIHLSPLNEKERWLQRRNSLSSQRAIYPYSPTSLIRPHAYRPSTASSRTLRSATASASASFDFSDRSSSFTSSSASTASRRYHRKPPTFPSIPELPRSVENLPYEAVPAPPPAWSPLLQHTPLSADPLIRALTAPAARARTSPPPAYPVPSLPATTPGVPTIQVPVPAMPKQAAGHVGRPSTGTNHTGRPSTSHTRPSTTSGHTRSSACQTNASVRKLRRPPSIRYPNRQRLWTYAPPAHGVRPSMYSMSSYGTRSSAYTRL